MPTTINTSTELLQAIATAEQIANNLDCEMSRQARDEYANEDCRGPLLTAYRESVRTAGPRAMITIKLRKLFESLGRAYQAPHPSYAPAIRGYCRAIRDYLGAVAPAPATVRTNGTKHKRQRRKPGELNATMLNMLMERPESPGWTARKWGKELKANASQITEQRAWKELEQARKLQKIDRQKSKRQGRVAK